MLNNIGKSNFVAKYYKKVKDGSKFKYFYSPKEYNAWVKNATKSPKDFVNDSKEYFKDASDYVKSKNKGVKGSLTRARIKFKYSVPHQTVKGAYRDAKSTVKKSKVYKNLEKAYNKSAKEVKKALNSETVKSVKKWLSDAVMRVKVKVKSSRKGYTDTRHASQKLRNSGKKFVENHNQAPELAKERAKRQQLSNSYKKNVSPIMKKRNEQALYEKNKMNYVGGVQRRISNHNKAADKNDRASARKESLARTQEREHRNSIRKNYEIAAKSRKSTASSNVKKVVPYTNATNNERKVFEKYSSNRTLSSVKKRKSKKK